MELPLGVVSKHACFLVALSAGLNTYAKQPKLIVEVRICE